ncbi:MAG: tetratricopeptide repeat protein [Elusimicrobiota bacterium]
MTPAIIGSIERGCYGPRLERILLRRIRGRAAADIAAAEEIFSTLVHTSKYAAAFRLDQALTRDGREAVLLGWRSYCRAILLIETHRYADAADEYHNLRRLRSRRHYWMHQPFVRVFLLSGDCASAAAVARHVLKYDHGAWDVHCRQGEALIVAGRTAEGLRQFSMAEAASGRSKADALAWHGEALLWVGRYRQALEKLNEAVSAGNAGYAFSWRGAARLKLGDLEGAVADLDEALARQTTDIEAHVWRGEALRLMRRYADAVADCDRAVALDANCWWGYINRALAKHALGDEPGLRDDFLRVPALATAPIGKSAREQVEILESCLEKAKGLRRWESYLEPLWLGRLFPSSGPNEIEQSGRRTGSGATFDGFDGFSEEGQRVERRPRVE